VGHQNSKSEGPVDFGNIVAEAQWNLQTTIRESQARIACGELATLPADERQMICLFQNLIANAIKYRNANRTPEVTISGSLRSGWWTFCVEDNGIGFDMANTKRIFGIFQRLHSRKEYDGTGIGLAICKRIVELHGGTIWAESVLGEGSKFFFTIPTRTGDAALQAQRSESERWLVSDIDGIKQKPTTSGP
jgi:light-regulated signal transduction histidine kinase (bacteriophytochrome)